MRKYKSLRALFRAKSRWCQGSFAKTAAGKAVTPSSKNATSFCLLGGIRKVYGNGEKAREITEKLRTEIDRRYYMPIVGFNDKPRRQFHTIQAIVRALKV